MKRWIRSNSEVGHYKGIRYGMEDDGDQRYYFVNDGEVTYADTEEELFARIDEALDDFDNVESATDACSQCDVRYLTYQQVRSLIIKALAKHDRGKILELQRSKFYDAIVSDMKSAMGITASQEIMLARI